MATGRQSAKNSSRPLLGSSAGLLLRNLIKLRTIMGIVRGVHHRVSPIIS